MDLEKLYLKAVVKANRGRLRDTHHTIIDYEVARMSGHAFWLNPRFIKAEDRKYFPKEALTLLTHSTDGKENSSSVKRVKSEDEQIRNR